MSRPHHDPGNKDARGRRRLWPLPKLTINASSFALLLFCSLMLFSSVYIMISHHALGNGHSGNSGEEPTKNDKAQRERSLRINPYVHPGSLDDFFFFQSPFFDVGPAFFHQNKPRSVSLIPTSDHASKSFINGFFSSMLPPPGYEITELDKNIYQIQMELPGTKASDINIELVENASVLRISASRRKETRDGAMVSESHFEKRFSIGEVDSDKITAKLEDGLLTLVVPKKDEPKEKPNVKIPITSTEGNGPLPLENGMFEQL